MIATVCACSLLGLALAASPGLTPPSPADPAASVASLPSSAALPSPAAGPPAVRPDRGWRYTVRVAHGMPPAARPAAGGDAAQDPEEGGQPVPEPGTLLLVGSGIVALAVGRRWRRGRA